MKALVVLTQPPLPEGGAPGKCAVALLRGLVAHGVEVRALAARQHFAVAGEPPADLPVEVVDVPPEPPGWAARANRWRHPRGELGRGIFAERVREAARAVDVVHLEETETAWCDQGIATPSLVHMHFLVRRDRSFGPPWRGSFRDVLEFSAAERAAVRRHRHLVASSPLVLEALHRHAPDADLTLAPLALDPTHYDTAPLDGPPVVGLIGTASWPPTRAAILRLVTRVWPHIHRRVPDARLVIAGRGSERLPGLSQVPGVEIRGEVESAARFMRDLSVLLYPLERGSGVKVKVLESIAMGVPVVTTPEGAEGIDAGAGVTIEVDDAALAAATVTLLRDDEERRERGRIARSAFELRYTPKPATAPLLDLYQRVAESRPQKRRTVAPIPLTSKGIAGTVASRRGRVASSLGYLGADGRSTPLGEKVAVLSPHLDDGVFSLGAGLAQATRHGAEVTVLTVLAGDPESTAPAGPWDARAGFSSAGEAARVRREEDRAACAVLGARPVWLPFCDEQYERGADEDEVWAAVTDVISAAKADTVLVPAFPLNQPDHAWLADLVARRGLDRVRVGLYLEQPYATLWAGSSELLDEARSRSRGHRGNWLAPSATLTDRVAKLRSCRAYSSQLKVLGRLILPQMACFEAASGGESISWSEPPPADRDGG